jgi:primosomal protein N' (replication factor Y)
MRLTLDHRTSVVRVIPDIDAVSGEYDYKIPESWMGDKRVEQIQVGTIVRFRFRNRIIRGWVSEIDPLVTTDKELQPLKQISGMGPTEEIIQLARWSAHHWQGSLAKFLRIASPKTMIKTNYHAGHKAEQDLSEKPLPSFSCTLVRIPPTGDRWPQITQVIEKGNALILVPSLYQARLLVGRLKKIGIEAGLHGRDWLLGARGGTIVGTRSAAFAPIHDLSGILMIDEHDSVYESESAPTWHARDVVIERAKRLEIPTIFTSPIPTPELRAKAAMQNVAPDEEKAGWGNIKVVDPREDGTSRGGLWPRVTVDAIKDSKRAIVILNRKGRSKLLACAVCNELTMCTECGSGMHQSHKDVLICARNNHERPVSCAHCLSTRLKNLRIGITKAIEELEHLLHENVQEIQRGTKELNLDASRVFLGTKAALHRVDWADLVVFADFDQDLFMKGYRSEEQALTSMVRAIRITNAVGKKAGNVFIQTRSPDNQLVEVIRKREISEWAEMETNRRSLLSLPPFGSYAAISGPGAEEFVSQVPLSEKLEILGPSEGSWMIKSSQHSDLISVLSETPRPSKRLRIAVNSLSG